MRDLVKHQKLISIFINDLRTYMEKAREYLGQKSVQINDFLEAPLFEEGFNHS